MKKVSGVQTDFRQCADPSLPVAGTSCCWPTSNMPVTDGAGDFCRFPGEMVGYDTAVARCASKGTTQRVCPTHDLVYETTGKPPNLWKMGCGAQYYTWLSEPCGLQVQVHENGWVSGQC